MIRNEKGQGMVEYIVMVALIAIAAIGIVGTLGENVRRHFANTNNRFISPNYNKIEQIEAREAEYKDRDMHDYTMPGKTNSNSHDN